MAKTKPSPAAPLALDPGGTGPPAPFTAYGLELLARIRLALTDAPNPRQVGGPPGFWKWYDGTRLEAIQALDELGL